MIFGAGVLAEMGGQRRFAMLSIRRPNGTLILLHPSVLDAQMITSMARYLLW